MFGVVFEGLEGGGGGEFGRIKVLLKKFDRVKKEWVWDEDGVVGVGDNKFKIATRFVFFFLFFCTKEMRFVYFYCFFFHLIFFFFLNFFFFSLILHYI